MPPNHSFLTGQIRAKVSLREAKANVYQVRLALHLFTCTTVTPYLLFTDPWGGESCGSVCISALFQHTAREYQQLHRSLLCSLYSPQKLTPNQVVFYKWKSLQTEQRQPVENACKLRGKHNSVENKMSHEMAHLGNHSCVYYNLCLKYNFNPPNLLLTAYRRKQAASGYDCRHCNSITSICLVLQI